MLIATCSTPVPVALVALVVFIVYVALVAPIVYGIVVTDAGRTRQANTKHLGEKNVGCTLYMLDTGGSNKKRYAKIAIPQLLTHIVFCSAESCLFLF